MRQKATNKIVFFIFILICFSSCNSGKKVSGRIVDVWEDYDVVVNEQLGMMIHVKFSVKRMRNKQGSCNIWFYHDDRTPLADVNEKYCTYDDKVATWDTFIPSYKKSIFHNYRLFIPYDEFHLRPGFYNLTFRIGLFNNYRILFANSEFCDFDFTQI